MIWDIKAPPTSPLSADWFNAISLLVPAVKTDPVLSPDRMNPGWPPYPVPTGIPQSRLSGLFTLSRPAEGRGLLKLFAVPSGCYSINLSANPTYLDFGQTKIYTSVSRSFAVSNNGSCDANLNPSSSMPFTVSGGRTIKAGQTVYFNVSFNPTRAGSFHGYVSGGHGISVSLSGTAVDPSKK